MVGDLGLLSPSRQGCSRGTRRETKGHSPIENTNGRVLGHPPSERLEVFLCRCLSSIADSTTSPASVGRGQNTDQSRAHNGVPNMRLSGSPLCQEAGGKACSVLIFL